VVAAAAATVPAPTGCSVTAFERHLANKNEIRVSGSDSYALLFLFNGNYPQPTIHYVLRGFRYFLPLPRRRLRTTCCGLFVKQPVLSSQCCDRRKLYCWWHWAQEGKTSFTAVDRHCYRRRQQSRQFHRLGLSLSAVTLNSLKKVLNYEQHRADFLR